MCCTDRPHSVYEAGRIMPTHWVLPSPGLCDKEEAGFSGHSRVTAASPIRHTRTIHCISRYEGVYSDRCPVPSALYPGVCQGAPPHGISPYDASTMGKLEKALNPQFHEPSGLTWIRMKLMISFRAVWLVTSHQGDGRFPGNPSVEPALAS